MKNKLLAAPYIVWMALFILIPLGIVVYYALTDSITGQFTLANLASIGSYLPIFLRSIWLSLFAALICLVKFFGRKFECVDKGFEKNEPVDVVIRPEDIDIVPADQGHLCGTVTSVTFKGVHYDTIVDFKGFKWLIQTTDYYPVDSYIGIRLNPEDIHIMHKSEYSGLYGDYSSYSAEYDEIAEAMEDEEDEE